MFILQKEGVVDEDSMFSFSKSWNYKPSSHKWVPVGCNTAGIVAEDNPSSLMCRSQADENNSQPTYIKKRAFQNLQNMKYNFPTSSTSLTTSKTSGYSPEVRPNERLTDGVEPSSNTGYRRQSGSESNLQRLSPRDSPTSGRDHRGEALKCRAKALLSQFEGFKRRSVNDLVNFSKSFTDSDKKSWQLSCTDLKADEHNDTSPSAHAHSSSPWCQNDDKLLSKSRAKLKKKYGKRGRSSSDTTFLGYGRNYTQTRATVDGTGFQVSPRGSFSNESRPLLIPPSNARLRSRVDAIDGATSPVKFHSGNEDELDVIEPEPFHFQKRKFYTAFTRNSNEENSCYLSQLLSNVLIF